jgi:NAD-dependent dihydropyrimidine dehydrogenase PreA subunit
MPIIAYAEDCVVCNFCEVSCTESAIKVVVDYSLPFPCSYIAGQC